MQRIRLRTAIATSVVIRGAGTLLQVVLGVLLARLLGPSEFGVYSYVLALVGVLGIPVHAGLPTLVVREAAKYAYQNRWSEVRGLIQSASVMVITGSVVIAGFLALAALAGEWSSSLDFSALVLLSLLVPLFALDTIRGAVLQGLGHVVVGQLPETVIRPAITLCLLAGLMAGGNQFSANVGLMLNAFGALAAFGIGALILRRVASDAFRNVKARYDVRAWGKALLPMSIGGGLQTANSNFALIVLGAAGTVSSVGLYKVALQGVAVLVLVLNAVSAVLVPRLAQLMASRSLDAVQAMTTKTALLFTAVTIPPAVVIAFAAEPAISLIFGEAYQGAAPVLMILSLGQVVNAMTGPAVSILNLAGRERDAALAIGAGLMVGLGLALVLVADMGAAGAGVGMAVSVSAMNIVMAIMAWSHVGINTTIIPTSWLRPRHESMAAKS